MTQTPEPFEDPESQLPPQLVADLRALQVPPALKAGVDQAILTRARVAFVRQRRARWVMASFTAGAIAATIVLFVIVQPFSASPPAPLADARDLNRDGRVDILDAFSLARRLDQDEALPAWDFNHDGQVNRRDVDAVAVDAVKLSHLTASATQGRRAAAGLPLLCEVKGGVTMMGKRTARGGQGVCEVEQFPTAWSSPVPESTAQGVAFGTSIIMTPPSLRRGWATRGGGAS